MQTLARFLVRRPVAWTVLFVTILMVLPCALFAGRVRQEDDLLAFLPEDSEEIAEFHAIADRFGGLDVALIGVETADVFDPAFLARVADATKRLRETQGVDRVLTLSNVQDFVEDPIAGGVRITDLVDRMPRDDADREALRGKVMSRDHVVGTLVSEDGKAVVLYCFLAWGSEPRVVADRMQATARAAFPDDELYWGGAPFISTWVYETTQDDLARLVPWSVLVIVVITVLSFRNVFGAALGLLATGVGILVARGVMGFLDVADNLVLASMPVVLFAVGSAYSIHVLSRYYSMVHEGLSPEDAVVKAVEQTGPTVLAAGGTTVAGLMSFLTMDIAPMRTFGLFSGLGVAIAMVVAITVVPAVVVLWRPRPYVSVSGTVERWTGAAMNAVQRHARALAGLFVLILAVGVVGVFRVDSRVDDTAFFTKNSPPAKATAFLDTHFGGSRFLQVQVEGDLGDPTVLREVQRVADRIERVDGVAGVQAVPRVVALVNSSMTGARRIPDTREQVGVLYGFLAGDPSVDQLVVADRTAGLLIVRLSASDVDAIARATDGVEAVLAGSPSRYEVRGDEAGRAWLVEAVAERISAEVGGDRAALAARLQAAPPPVSAASVRPALAAFLASEENFAPVEPRVAEAVADAVAALGPGPDDAAVEAAITQALGPDADPMLAGDLVVALAGPVPDAWRTAEALAWAEALAADGLIADPHHEAVVGALQDLEVVAGMVASDAPDAATLGWTVSGQPVIYEAMSRSVNVNQVKSLVVAMGVVWILLAWLFGSVSGGLLASVPMIVTLLLIYAAMGFAGIRLDIGTSMIASLVIGAGVDYAVHLMAAWRAREGGDVLQAAREAADHTATAIWTNALMVSAGFAVLATGHARPLRNVGTLVAVALLLAALATFAGIPLLARRTRYGR